MVRPRQDQLSGVVEVDETYIGGKKSGKRGRWARGKTLVMVAAEVKDSHIGQIRLQQIPDASTNSLEYAVQQIVKQGSTVQTDDWNGYIHLNQIGYKHTVVRESSDVGDNLLPYCHRTVALLKRWLLGTLQGAVSHAHLDYYLDEFTFRFNRRTSRHRGKLFHRLLQQAIAVEPVPLKSIIKHVRGRK